jgi:hypothetical protein
MSRHVGHRLPPLGKGTGRLRFDRTELTEQSTIGKLFVDDAFECYTLEDCVRPQQRVGDLGAALGGLRGEG